MDYSSSNDDTNPKEPIKLLEYDAIGKESFGKFVFERIDQETCIDRYELYETIEEATAASDKLECTNYHQHPEQLPGPSYMACENHQQTINEEVAC